MAKNPNTSLYNVNTLYLACSGGGKSQALKQNKTIPRQGVRVLLWDIDHDHAANRFENMPEYIRAVKSAIKSGQDSGWHIQVMIIRKCLNSGAGWFGRFLMVEKKRIS